MSLAANLREIDITKIRLSSKRPVRLSSIFSLNWQGFLFSVGTVAISTFVMLQLGVKVYIANMVYMLLTLLATAWFGLTPGLIVSILAFLCFDYFYLPPLFTFIIYQLQDWVAVFLFLGTAVFANQLAGRARYSSQSAQERGKEITALYELATTVITRIDRTDMLQAVLYRVLDALEMNSCTLFLADRQDLYGNPLSIANSIHVERINSKTSNNVSVGSFPPDLGLALATFRRNQASFFVFEDADDSAGSIRRSVLRASYFSAANLKDISGLVVYVPITSESNQLGVLMLEDFSRLGHQVFYPEKQRLIEIFANHVALAIEHARLIEETAQIAALRDSDRFKSTLLATVSHELRTPLTAIKTATDNLAANDIDWSPDEQVEFLNIIEQETARLTRLVSNLLDLSKIEAGALKPNLGWYYLPEIVEEVVERLCTNLLVTSHPITVTFDDSIPLTQMDYVQIDQVLTNLIENAAKYSEENSPVQIEVQLTDLDKIRIQRSPQFATRQVLLLKVTDAGIGVPEDQLERIFDKFYRVQDQSKAGEDLNTKASGSGIGLTIAKGIIEAHGGEIWAKNRLYGGTIFNFWLPVTESPFPLD